MKKLTYLPLLLALLLSTLLPAAAYAAPVPFTINSNDKGTVTGPGINCGSDCSEAIEDGTIITLTATPQPGMLLTQGDGCPSGFHSGPVTCTISLNIGNANAYFLWTFASHNVTATIEGAGTGTVTGTGTYALGTTYTLVANPNAGSVFAGWQTSGNICRSGGGKGGSMTVNPSPTCSEQVGGSTSTLTAVARFDKTSSSQPPSATTGSGSTPTTNTPSTTPETTKPAAPTLGDIAVAGSTYKPTDKVSVASNEPLILSGKTVPNGKVTLYVFSEPKKYEIQADAEGKWSYTVTGLPPGDHHAEIEVTDPATGQTSERAQLMAFTVTEAKAKTQSVATDDTGNIQNKSAIGTWIAIGVTTFATAIGVGLVIWKHKHPGISLSVLNPFKRK